MSRLSRRVLDRSIAAVIAIVVAVTAFVIWQTSDIHQAQLVTATGPAGTPTAPAGAPTTLAPRWSLSTDAELGAVISPFGSVVTADLHGVTAHDIVTGTATWSYRRANRTLCAIGSGDIAATAGVGGSWGNVNHGIMTVYNEGDACSQFMSFQPTTGARYQGRTSDDQLGGQLTFGGPYAAWLGPTLVQVYAANMNQTIFYGDIPAPTSPNNLHLGCIFTDLAVTDQQFGTIEHCAAQGKDARLVINWSTPHDSPESQNWDPYRHQPRADIDTGATAARIVGITADRVAVLVSGPAPAVVVYDPAGRVMSRTSVDIPAADIVVADAIVAGHGRLTPAVETDSARYSLIGSHLIAVNEDLQDVPAPVTVTSTSSGTTVTSTRTPLPGIVTPSQSTISINGLVLAFTVPNALGLPAVAGDELLVPITSGLSVRSATSGQHLRDITVARGGYAGRIDATAVGSMVVEIRGSTVVGLAAAGLSSGG